MFETHSQPWDSNLNIEQTDEESRNLTNVSSRLKHMDELNIDAQVLYPTIFLAPCARDAAAEFALYHAYNCWLADIWKQAPNRLHWAAMAPLYSMLCLSSG